MTVNIYLESNIGPFERKDGMTAYVLEAEGMEGRTAADFINVEYATETGATLAEFGSSIEADQSKGRGQDLDKLHDRTGSVSFRLSDNMAAEGLDDSKGNKNRK